MTEKLIKEIGKRYLGTKSTGWDIEPQSGGIIVYAINAICLEGHYYDLQTGQPKKLTKKSYICDTRENFREGHKHDGIEGVGTGVVVYRREKDDVEFLLQLRTDCNKYGLLGGGLEPGDTFEMCACTEVLQEAAIVADPKGLELIGAYAGPKHISKHPNNDLVYHQVILYKLDYKKCVQLSMTEVDKAETKAIIWIEKSKLIEMLKNSELFFPNNYPIFEDIVKKFF